MMKIVVLGATGKTGQLLVSQALSRGWQVTAIVRRLGVLQTQPKLTVIEAELSDQARLAQQFSGADAVISCLGARPSLETLLIRSDFQKQTLPTIIAALNAAKVPRFVLMSSFGVGTTRRQAGWFLKLFLYSFMAKRLFDDKVEAEKSLADCQANWTAAYPVTLAKSAKDVAVDSVPLAQVHKVAGIPRLNFATVASELLNLATRADCKQQKLLLTPKGRWR